MSFTHSRRGWALVAVLLAAYAMSFVDRQILGLLVDDVRRDLSVDDLRMGLLMGPAFGLVYAALGMPCGWLADRVRRTRLIAVGLLLWTGATLSSGLAASFAQLAAARMAVGIGEAALVPAAVSLIADTFPPARRALPLAVFTAGISVGAGLALLLGGALVGFAKDGVGALPLIGAALAAGAPWRSVMVIAGLAGVPIALFIAVCREPVRGDRDAGGSGGRDGRATETLAAFLRRRRALLVPLLAATTLLYILSNGWSAWLPSAFIRGFGWTPPLVGARLGATVLVCALLGTLSGGAIAAWLGRRESSLDVMATGAALLVPAGLLAPLAGSAAVLLGGAAAFYIALSLCFGVATASLVAITPPPLRGRVVALYLLLGNLAGLGLGPPLVAALVEHVLRDPARVGTALTLLAVPTALPAAWLLMLARGRAAHFPGNPPPDNG